jgi:hypothetical protein
MSPAQAVTATRFATMVHQDSFNPAAERQSAQVSRTGEVAHGGLDGAVTAELSRRGHVPRQHSGAVGDPVMLCIDRSTGRMYAAGDPAAGRHAAALE